MKITLLSLERSTAENVFRQVASHLLLQNEKSLVNGHCVYYSLGRACAAASLIAGAEYNAEFENKPWKESYGRLYPSHIELISRMQEIHDHVCVEEWGVKLQTLGQEMGFDHAFIEKLI